jgi:hypothetical protein
MKCILQGQQLDLLEQKLIGHQLGVVLQLHGDKISCQDFNLIAQLTQ